MRWGTSTIYKNRILKVKKSLLEFNKDFEESKDRKLRNRLILTDIFCEVTFCKTFFCTSKNFFWPITLFMSISGMGIGALPMSCWSWSFLCYLLERCFPHILRPQYFLNTSRTFSQTSNISSGPPKKKIILPSPYLTRLPLSM